MTTVKRKSKQLGQILIEQGLITPAQLEQALEEHRKTPKSLGRVLIDLGHDQGGGPRPRPGRAGRAGVRRPGRLPHRSHRPRCCCRRRSRAGTARSRSGNATASSWWRCRTRRTSTRWTTSARSRTATSSRWWRPPPTSSRRSRSSPAWTARSRPLRRRPSEQLEGDDEQLEAALEEAPIVKLVQRDHDAGGRRPRLRRPHRADRAGRPRSGSAWTACCTSVMHSPKNIQGGLISRLKVMADLNIAEKRVPQDGRISMRVGGKHARPACRDAPDGLRREDRHPCPGQVQRAAAPGGPGLLRRRLQAVLGVVQQAVRRDPGHRADRFGQVDHHVRDAQHPEPGRHATSSPSRTRSSTGWTA